MNKETPDGPKHIDPKTLKVLGSKGAGNLKKVQCLGYN